LNKIYIGSGSSINIPTGTPGIYELMMIADNLYCSDTAIAGIHIQDAPEALFEVVSNACSNTIMVNSISKNANRFEWNFGDISSSYNVKQGASASHTYTSNGTYSIRLIAFNIAGSADTSIMTVTVTNANGVNKANFTYNNGLCNCRCQNLVRFKNLTPGTNTYLWSFGDGATTMLTNPSKGFPGAGFYQVTLTAVDSLGCMSTLTKTVEIDPSVSGPSASFNTDYQVQCLGNNNFNFYNTSTYMGTGWINKYYWYFGDGSMDSSNTFIYNKKYSSAGNYIVTLIAVGAEGCRDTMSMYIQVRPLPCSGVLKFVNLQDGSNWNIDPKLGGGEILNSLETLKDDKQYSLFPNPNRGNFCIQFKDLVHEPITITVVDVLGKQVYQKLHNQVGVNLLQLEIDNLSDGTYMLLITSESHQYKDQKFIVIH
jgi:PKD repeat protein